MMRDRRRQWIDPYPKWTPAESQWAHIWLVAVVLLVLVGILYGSINVYIVEQELVRFRRFPVVDEMYPVALTAAQEENLDARLAAVEIVSYEGTYEEALEYEVRFYFCSPTDQAWALEVGALRHFRLLREDVELRRMRNVSRSSTIFSGLACDDYSIEEMAYDIEYVSEGMRLALSEGRLENLETRPRLMKLTRNEQGTLLWTAVFKYARTDYALRVVLDAESGVLESVERIEFPEYWSSERYWRARFIR